MAVGVPSWSVAAMVFAAALSLSPWPCLGGSRACCEAVAAGLCTALLSGFRRCLFARRATALGSSGGAPWLAAPWPCLSCSCACCRALAGRPWRVFLVGFEGPSKPQFSALFRSLFPRRATALAEGVLAGCALAVSCSCACCRALAARPWRVFLVGFEGMVVWRHSFLVLHYTHQLCDGPWVWLRVQHQQPRRAMSRRTN